MVIYLLGYMGSGKSTIGRLLAERMDLPFIETDQIVEDTMGMTVRDIFALRGEDTFREAEFLALQTTTMLRQAVVALGGGTPCSERSMALIKGHGVSVYLRLSAGTLALRLAGSAGERPVLVPFTKGDWLANIRAHLNQREKWYLKATILTDAEAGPPGVIAENIRKQIADYQNTPSS